MLVVKNLPANSGDVRDTVPTPGKISWRRARQHTPVFLPGESRGQRSQPRAWYVADHLPKCLPTGEEVLPLLVSSRRNHI